MVTATYGRRPRRASAGDPPVLQRELAAFGYTPHIPSPPVGLPLPPNAGSFDLARIGSTHNPVGDPMQGEPTSSQMPVADDHPRSNVPNIISIGSPDAVIIHLKKVTMCLARTGRIRREGKEARSTLLEQASQVSRTLNKVIEAVTLSGQRHAAVDMERTRPGTLGTHLLTPHHYLERARLQMERLDEQRRHLEEYDELLFSYEAEYEKVAEALFEVVAKLTGVHASRLKNTLLSDVSDGLSRSGENPCSEGIAIESEDDMDSPLVKYEQTIVRIVSMRKEIHNHENDFREAVDQIGPSSDSGHFRDRGIQYTSGTIAMLITLKEMLPSMVQKLLTLTREAERLRRLCCESGLLDETHDGNKLEEALKHPVGDDEIGQMYAFNAGTHHFGLRPIDVAAVSNFDPVERLEIWVSDQRWRTFGLCTPKSYAPTIVGIQDTAPSLGKTLLERFAMGVQTGPRAEPRLARFSPQFADEVESTPGDIQGRPRGRVNRSRATMSTLSSYSRNTCSVPCRRRLDVDEWK